MTPKIPEEYEWIENEAFKLGKVSFNRESRPDKIGMYYVDSPPRYVDGKWKVKVEHYWELCDDLVPAEVTITLPFLEACRLYTHLTDSKSEWEHPTSTEKILERELEKPSLYLKGVYQAEKDRAQALVDKYL